MNLDVYSRPSSLPLSPAPGLIALRAFLHFSPEFYSCRSVNPNARSEINLTVDSENPTRLGSEELTQRDKWPRSKVTRSALR